MRPASGAKLLRARDNAEVGVGTLIVFIAMVLVAAVAAAVIIGTSGSLQQRAQATGREATDEVSSNMMLVDATGFRNDSSAGIHRISLYLMPSAGAQAMDLSQMVVRFTDGTNVRVYRYNGTPDFQLNWIRGEGFDNVILAGDLVELTFDTQNHELAPSETFELQLMPSIGSPMGVDMKMPSTYGRDTVIQLN